MKRASAIILILLAISICGYSQDTLSKSKPSQYVIVYIEPTITHNSTIATYSNGETEDLAKKLDLGYNVYFDNYKYEMRLLDYFDKKDYELVSVSLYAGRNTKYYFKHK